MTSTFIKFVVLGFMATTAAATASAGEWVLNQNKCPDLIEDRRDQRATTSRRDAIEDRKDMRVIECPRSAWTYVPSRGERVNAHLKYDGPTVIYSGRNGYYRDPIVKTKAKNHKNTKTTPALIQIVIR